MVEEAKNETEQSFGCSLGCLGLLVAIVLGTAYMLFLNVAFCMNAKEVKATCSTGYTKTERRVKKFGITTNKSTSYSVNYTYTVDGKPYSGVLHFDSPPPPATATVFYDPRHPAKSRATKPSAHWFHIAIIVCFSFLAIAYGKDLPDVYRKTRKSPEGIEGEQGGGGQ